MKNYEEAYRDRSPAALSLDEMDRLIDYDILPDRLFPDPDIASNAERLTTYRFVQEVQNVEQKKVEREAKFKNGRPRP